MNLVNFGQQKLEVVKFLLYTLVAISSFGWVIAVSLILSAPGLSTTLNFAVSSLLLMLLVGLRHFLSRFGYARTYLVVSVLLLITAFYTFLLSGTANAIGIILLTIVLVTAAIVFNTRVAITYAITEVVGLIIILFLHRSGLVVYFPYTSESQPETTLVIVMFIALFANIVRLGYSEIAKSYLQARSYASELVKLNKQLDRLVKLRTRQLEQSYQSRVDSVYKTAVMGMVTQAMLHDLSTPISALKGAVSILDDVEDQETLRMANLSLGQIERVVQNGRELMSGRPSQQSFYVAKVLSNAISVISHELYKSSIVILTDCDPKIKIKGNQALFERTIINLILNSIEELKQTARSEKEIKIAVETSPKGVKLIQEDNGRGIDPNVLPYIFDTDFSSKSKDGNLGLGLAFVKQTMEKNYRGSVTVASKLGEFTRFTLFFPQRDQKTRTVN